MGAVAIKEENVATKTGKLILVDGYGFVFRAYHALARQNLTRADGTPVGAVYAFTNMLLKMINDHTADYMVVVFDAGKDTFRNDIYSEYKANRPPAPDDLIPQFPLVREAAEALNLAVIEKKGYEADDLIATYTKRATESGHEVCIISSDKDLMQLVGEGVEMFDPLKSRVIGSEQVLEKFGVAPDKVLDVLSLMGDSSDNIPGVPGIGPKTAAELINRFGSLDEVLASTEQITQKKRREALEENKQQALLSRELISLCYDVPIDNEIEEFAVKDADHVHLVKFLKEQGFKSLMNKFQGLIDAEARGGNSAPKTLINSKLLTDVNALREWANSLGEIEKIAINIEKDTKTKAEIGIALSVADKSVYMPFEAQSAPQQTNLFGEVEAGDASAKAGSADTLAAIKEVMLDKSIVKIGHDIKGLFKKSDILNFDDIMVMSYTLEAGLHAHDLDNMIIRHHNDEVDDLMDVKTLAGLEPEKAMIYACKRSNAILNIHSEFKQRLFEEKVQFFYEKIDKPLIKVIADMEVAGIKLDGAKLKELSGNFAVDIKKYEEEIHKLAGQEFNIGSPKQLGEVLFDKLGLSGGKKSKKTGAYSTDVKVLQALSVEGHEIAAKVLQWRHLSKIKSTYSDSLPKQIESDGRVHTNFSTAVTSTGRLSSHDPNLQNIPIRSEEGNKIREAFVAEKGFKLISADYSQIELRLLAHIADIDVLKDAFKNKLDIHAATASQMFGVELDKVDSELRRKAKTINFGIIYGISAFGLAERLGISRPEAAEYIKQYFQQYPGIEKYMEDTVEFARKHNYVQTIWGRRCYINGINDRNHAVKQFSERAAINAPLQGSAADIIKKAMVVLDRELKRSGYKSKALLQVHDELIIEAPENEAEKVSSLIKSVMESVAILSVPIVVDSGIGNNWREIH